MHMLTEIGEPSKAAAWLQGRFDHQALVMGFGHRVYKHGDSRVPTMTKYAEQDGGGGGRPPRGWR